jgi:hypothetical protein
VEVKNGGGTVSSTKVIAISPAITAPTTVTINGPVTGTIDTSYNFSATVGPVDVTMPLTYSWSPVPATGQGTAEVSYSWPTTGTQTIMVTVTNTAGEQSSSHIIQTMITPTVNTPPQATDDVVTTTLNTPVTIPVLNNDSDPDGDALTVVLADGATNGQATIGDEAVTYMPNDSFAGGDSFTYTIADGQGGTASARVTVIVAKPNEPVIATQINTATDTTINISHPNVGVTAVVQVPTNVYTRPFVLVYTVLTSTAHGSTEGWDTAEVYLVLDAYVDGQLQHHPFPFLTPLSITLSYRDEDVTHLDETTLKIYYWNEDSQSWVDDGIMNQPPDTVNNKVVAAINHLTEFALFGQIKRAIYLPIVVRH